MNRRDLFPSEKRDSAAEESGSHRAADWMFLQPAILDQMHDSVVTTDMQGTITGSNRTTHQIYGYGAQELLGKPVTILYAEEYRRAIHEQVIPAVLATGEYHGEVRKRTRSGDYLYVHLSAALLRDGEGTPVGMVGFSVDVTAQKLGNLALKHREQLEQKLDEQTQNLGPLKTLMRAVERSNDVILITEAEPLDEPGPRVVYVNPAFERMTGYAAEEILGKTPRMLQGPKTDRAALSRIRRALVAGDPVREELVNYRKDGSEFFVELSMVPVAGDDGVCSHFCAIQREMTEQHKLRRELRSTNSLLRTLTESVPQLLWTSDADGRREWVSDSFAAFVGAEVKDCLGDGWVRYVHPQDREVALAKLQACRQQRRVCTTELRLLHCSGEYVWFLKQAAPRFGTDGEVSKWIGSFTDISDRRAAEAALQASEERLRLGLTVARLALGEVDFATGLTHLTAEAAAMYGLGREAVVVPREVIRATFHPDDREKVLAASAASEAIGGPDWFEIDHRVIWPGGEVRWLRVRKQSFFAGECSGRHAVRAILAVFDITESKRAEAAARQGDRRFRHLAESLPHLAFVADAEGRTVYCNRHYLDYTGIANIEELDRTWQDHIHPEDREPVLACWRSALKTQTLCTETYRLRRSDGEYRRFIARAIPVHDEAGKLDQWVGSITEVQESKLDPTVSQEAGTENGRY
jgi:PAS domain S-box-containing protein